MVRSFWMAVGVVCLCLGVSLGLSACGGGEDGPPDRGVFEAVYVGQDDSSESPNKDNGRERPELCAWLCGLSAPIANTTLGLGGLAVNGSLFFTPDAQNLSPGAFTGVYGSGFTYYVDTTPEDAVIEIQFGARVSQGLPETTVTIVNDNIQQQIIIRMDSPDRDTVTTTVPHSSLVTLPNGRKGLPVFRFTGIPI